MRAYRNSLAIAVIIAGGLIVALPPRSAVTSPAHLVQAENAGAPFAHTRFCLNYPDECKAAPLKDAVTLTPKRRAELTEINEQVNGTIVPQAQPSDPVKEDWKIAPAAGDCNDYAVTKRHELVRKGWPAGAVLLSEVQLPSGEHHLVVVARTNAGDMVLDNLKPNVQQVAEIDDYKWLRMVSPENPMFWKKIQKAS